MKTPHSPEPGAARAGTSARTLLAAVCAAFALAGAARAADAGTNAPAWPPADPAAVKRWQDMRFGMFIHWGPVALTGHEIGWSRGSQTPVAEYDELYKRFNPVQFNAREWAAAAKAAGMKYVVLTTKHHDGFCLWDTKETPYNIMNTPFKRDVVKELAEACREQGLAFGAYYSTCDWYHPDFPLTSPGGKVRREKSDIDSYQRFLLAQIRELMTKYGPLITIWNDVPQEFKGRGAATIRMVRELQPDILINNRTGDGGDYDTPEQRVGKYQDNRPWETCMTICRQWAWKPNDDMKSLKECLQTLVLCAGGDGNLLFNVGPTAEGIIEERQVARLREMGAWLAKNGAAIYGTRGGPWKPTRAIASTRAGSAIFLHVMRASGGHVDVPDLGRSVKSAQVLGGGEVKVTQSGGRLRFSLDPAAMDPIDTIVRLEVEGSAMDIPAIDPDPTVKGTASEVFKDQKERFGPDQAFDNDPHTRWAAKAGSKSAWIAAEFPKPITVQRVRIEESQGERVKRFEFQYRDGSEWRTIAKGTTIGRWYQEKFEPVHAREFRLNILESSDGPSIADIEFIEK
jgi:alpha-L-fucosidase